MWLFDARCGETVEDAWTSTGDLDHTRAALQKVDKCVKDFVYCNMWKITPSVYFKLNA